MDATQTLTIKFAKGLFIIQGRFNPEAKYAWRDCGGRTFDVVLKANLVQACYIRHLDTVLADCYSTWNVVWSDAALYHAKRQRAALEERRRLKAA